MKKKEKLSQTIKMFLLSGAVTYVMSAEINLSEHVIFIKPLNSDTAE